MPKKNSPVVKAFPLECDMTDFVKRYIHFMPSPLSTVSLNGRLIASPHSEYLTTILTPALLTRAHQIDKQLRHPNASKVLSYNDFCIITDLAILNLGFITVNRDNPNTFNVYKESPQTYSTTNAIVMKLKLTEGFNLIKQCHQAMPYAKANHYSLKNMRENVIGIYNQLKNTHDIFLTHLTDYGHLIEPVIAEQLKHEFFQCYFESLLFKAQSNPEYTRAELASLGTDACIEHLEAISKSREHRLDLYLSKSRNTMMIHKSKDRALAIVEEGIQELNELAITDSLSDEALFDYNNHFVLLSAAIQRNIIDESLITNPTNISLEQINKLFDTFLMTKGTINSSVESIRSEFTIAIRHAILVLSIKMPAKIEYADHAMLAQLEQLTKKAFEVSRLLSTIQAGLSKGMHDEPTIDHTKNILKLISEIREKSKELAQAELENEKKYAELLEKMKDYEDKFTSILDSFKSKTSKIMKKRSITIYETPCSLPALPSASDANTETPAAPAPTLAQRAQEFFNSTAYQNIPQFLDGLADEQYAEGCLYVGDWYLSHHNLLAALPMYEEALKQIDIATNPNEMLRTAIRMRLEDTQALLAKQIRRASNHLTQLETMRSDFIIHLGIQKLRQSGAKEHELNPSIEANLEAIVIKGEEAFKSIGMAKQSQGIPLSHESQLRSNLKQSLNQLNHMLAYTSQVLKTASKDSTQENFPTLQQSASMFHQQKTKHKTANGNHKPSRKHRQ